MPAAYTRSTVPGKFPQPLKPLMNPDSRQRAQVWDAATGLPGTPTFPTNAANRDAISCHVGVPV
jgi:hypothetical protein